MEPPLWRIRGEYLLWWTNANNLPPLVTTSPPNTPVGQAGVLGTPGVQTLFGGHSIDGGDRSGGRVTLTRWLEDAGGPAIEFVGFYLADDYQSGEFFAQSDGSVILSRPFFDPRVNQNRENAELVAYPNRLAGAVTVDSYSEAYSAAGLLRQTFVGDEYGRIDLIGGYRYLRYRESLSIREQLLAINPGGLTPLGTTTDLIDRFLVGNDFHGGEVGMAAEWMWDIVSIELLGKVALGGIFQQSIIDGSTVVTIPDEPPTTTAGGLLALPTNMGARSQGRFSVLPELNLNAAVLVTPRLTVTGGYTLIILTNVLRSGDQIDRTVNPSQLGGQPLVGPPRPQASFNDSTLVMQGLSFGLDFRW
jgi:hypothetical protein